MKYGTMSYLCIDEKVLMIKKCIRENDPNSGFHTLPGGNLEDIEKGLRNPAGRIVSAVRETWEETGLTIIDPKLRGAILFDNSERIFDDWKNPQDFFVYMFEANKYTGVLNKKTKEGISLWINKREIFNVPKNSGDEKIYEWLSNPCYFIGVIKHKGKELDEQRTYVDFYEQPLRI